MEKTKEELSATMRELEAKMQTAASAEEREDLLSQHAILSCQYDRMNREDYNKQLKREQSTKSANEQMREAVKAVRMHHIEGEFNLSREGVTTIASSNVEGGNANMTAAGLPITIGDLINPLEMGTIYNKVGIKVATGVKGQLQWPCLDTTAEVSVGGELDAVDEKVLDFSKIVTTPVKLGIAVPVSNEAINDASFDLVGVIKAQINAALGRTINNRVLALSAPSVKPAFVGPFVSHKQTGTITSGAPTYKEVKALKAKVLKTGAQMAGFCYVMDAEMYSLLECTPKDNGSGLFVIEGGKIDGDNVFITDLAAYEGKIAAGCFGYQALNFHGATNFVIDPYTQAKKNVTLFVLNVDASLTYLVSTNNTKGAPFVVA